MKVVVAGDWHGNTRYGRAIIKEAQDVGASAILHVGDFGYDYHSDFINGLTSDLRKAKMKIFVTLGNHENYDVIETMNRDDNGFYIVSEWIKIFPRGQVFEIGGATFMSLGGAVSVDKKWRTPGIEWWPQESLSFQDCENAIQKASQGIDIMICHDVPAGFDIPAIQGNPFGFPAESIRASEEHRDMLRAVVDEVKPKMLFAGHYHTRESGKLYGDGYETQIEILNADGSPLAQNFYVLDLDDYSKS